MSYTMTREDFVEAVSEATWNEDLIKHAKKQKKFALGAYYIPEEDCGCVVGEFLNETQGIIFNGTANDGAKAYGAFLEEEACTIDESVQRRLLDLDDTDYTSSVITNAVLTIID